MHNEFFDFQNIFLAKIKQLLLLRFVDRDLLIIPIFMKQRDSVTQWAFSIFLRIGKHVAATLQA